MENIFDIIVTALNQPQLRLGIMFSKNFEMLIIL